MPAFRWIYLFGKRRFDLEYSDYINCCTDAAELASDVAERIDGGGLHRDGLCEWRSAWGICRCAGDECHGQRRQLPGGDVHGERTQRQDVPSAALFRAGQASAQAYGQD